MYLLIMCANACLDAGLTVNKRTLVGFFGGIFALVSVFAKLFTVLGASGEQAQLVELTREVEALREQLGGSNHSSAAQLGVGAAQACGSPPC